MKPSILLCYRLLALMTHIYVAKWIFDIWGFKLRTFCFLTKINFFLNMGYFAYALCINYHYETKSNHQKTANSLFKLCYSLAIVVLILYWSLCFFFPNMLGTTQIPMLLDLFLHGGNLVVLMLDYFIDFERQEKKNTYLNKSFLFKLSIFYITLLYLLYYFMNIEVYPLVSKMNFIQYGAFCLGGSGLFLVGQSVFDLIH
jgi:hypothetical protein